MALKPTSRRPVGKQAVTPARRRKPATPPAPTPADTPPAGSVRPGG